MTAPKFTDWFDNKELPAYERAKTREVLAAARDRQDSASNAKGTRPAQAGPVFTDRWGNSDNPLTEINKDGSL